MADVRTAWSLETAPLRGDWLIDPPGLAADHDLETAVILSLFTDALAREDDVIPDLTDDRRGWWGNWESPEALELGSRLWLLSREKSTEETRRRAEEYAAEALAWMLDDDPQWGRVAARVDVEAEYVEVGPVPPLTLGLRIRIVRDDGSVYDRRYAWAWAQLVAEGVATDAITWIEASA
jgi:phage gp46-like protein